MGQLGQELELFEMFQSFKGYDARKRKSTVENDTGSGDYIDHLKSNPS